MSSAKIDIFTRGVYHRLFDWRALARTEAQMPGDGINKAIAQFRKAQSKDRAVLSKGITGKGPKKKSSPRKKSRGKRK